MYTRCNIKAWTTVTSVSCVKNAFNLLKMVVGSSAYRCDMFMHVNTLVKKITPRFFTDPLNVIEDAPICNAGVFRDLTQCGDAILTDESY